METGPRFTPSAFQRPLRYYEPMQRILIVCLLVASAMASAEIFRQIGPDGEVYFSDRPAPGAKSVDVRLAPTVRLPSANTSDTTEKGDSGGPSMVPEYAQFSIVKPSHNQGVRANDGSVTIYLELQPPLMPGHTIELSIDGEDGEKIRAGDTLNFNLSNMSRGRHVVSARVVDSEGKVQIKTGPVGFYVLRVALGR